MVSPIVGTTHLTKVLMDGRCDLNIVYTSTLDKMGIPWNNLCLSKAPFYGIIPGKETVPLRCIWLNVTFGQPENFRKELLTFEVVNFPSIYHALLGRPCFAKFMVIPNYTYLKAQDAWPKEVITIDGSFEQDCVAQVVVLVAPCDPNGPSHDAGRAPMKGAAKVAAVLDRPSIDR
jgi:hypothetical protein